MGTNLPSQRPESVHPLGPPSRALSPSLAPYWSSTFYSPQILKIPAIGDQHSYVEMTFSQDVLCECR